MSFQHPLRELWCHHQSPSFHCSSTEFWKGSASNELSCCEYYYDFILLHCSIKLGRFSSKICPACCETGTEALIITFEIQIIWNNYLYCQGVFFSHCNFSVFSLIGINPQHFIQPKAPLIPLFLAASHKSNNIWLLGVTKALNHLNLCKV